MGAWEIWQPGRAQGPLFGGLLNRLVQLQATPFALPPERFDGAVLFWEEVQRPVSRIWCDLHTLRLSGVLDRIAGMVVGIPSEVTPYESGGDRVGLRDVVLDVLAQRDIPVLAQVDFGHNSPNLPLPLGIRADVDADNRTLSLLESAVAES
jgi:muramoyltetrapeptide carboxypeptidase